MVHDELVMLHDEFMVHDELVIVHDELVMLHHHELVMVHHELMLHDELMVHDEACGPWASSPGTWSPRPSAHARQWNDSLEQLTRFRNTFTNKNLINFS